MGECSSHRSEDLERGCCRNCEIYGGNKCKNTELQKPVGIQEIILGQIWLTITNGIPFFPSERQRCPDLKEKENNKHGWEVEGSKLRKNW